MQCIPRDPSVSTPPTMRRKDMDDIFDDYVNHLVPDKALSTIVENNWSYVDSCIRWFFHVSHPYMIQDASGDPSRSTHQEILEENQARADHAHDEGLGVIVSYRLGRRVLTEDFF